MNVRKSKIVITLLAMVFVTGVFGLARANSTYSGYFNSAYPSSPLAGSGNCAVCHTSVPNLNPYGSDFKNHSKNQAALTAIESLDSDGDGSTNRVEINTGTFPGDPNSHPVVSDTIAPTITGFSIPATSASLTVSITTFTATDNIGVTGYLVTESATAPSASAAGWSPSAPSSYTFTTSGTKTPFAWARDAAGNVSSSLSATVIVTSSNPQPPTEDLTLWSGQWLKVTIKYEGYSLGISNPGLVQQDPMPGEEDVTTEMSKDHESVVAYLKITAWDPQQNVLQGQLYQHGSNNQWVHAPLTLHFIDGTRTDFLCWSQVSGDFTAGFTARLQGKESGGILKSGSFKTLGGYYFEIDSTGGTSSSQAFSGGQVSINGSLVLRTRVPVPDNALAQ
jgi:hypothetical protein